MSISKKDAEIQAKKIVNHVLKDNNFLSEILKGVISKNDSVRYPNAIALEILSEKNPEIVYPHWNTLVDLLKSKNAYHKSIGISVISNLTKIDKKKKFEEIFEDFFKLINDKSVVVARKLSIYSGKIAKAKPSLGSKITTILLSIDDTQHSVSRKDLIKGDIIVSLSEIFENIKDKAKIMEFVKNQLKSSSPSTVKKAKEFLSKWEMLS
jgi:DNA polymerase III epsilon subunit-like protein